MDPEHPEQPDRPEVTDLYFHTSFGMFRPYRVAALHVELLTVVALAGGVDPGADLPPGSQFDASLNDPVGHTSGGFVL